MKLARVLGVAEDELEGLDSASEEDVRALREQVTDRLFDAHRARLHGIAEAARVLPVALVANIGRRTFGPLLCARLAGLLEPERAVEVASRWPDEFTAAVAAEIDPRRASAVVAAMPADRTVTIARILAREHEHVAMGRFVGHLERDALRACVEAIDEESILRTAFVLEGVERIDEIVAAMPAARLRAMSRLAVEQGLDAEVEHLRGHLSGRQAGRLDTALAAAS